MKRFTFDHLLCPAINPGRNNFCESSPGQNSGDLGNGHASKRNLGGGGLTTIIQLYRNRFVKTRRMYGSRILAIRWCLRRQRKNRVAVNRVPVRPRREIQPALLVQIELECSGTDWTMLFIGRPYRYLHRRGQFDSDLTVNGRQIAYSCGAIASALDPVTIVISTRTV